MLIEGFLLEKSRRMGMVRNNVKSEWTEPLACGGGCGYCTMEALVRSGQAGQARQSSTGRAGHPAALRRVCSVV